MRRWWFAVILSCFGTAYAQPPADFCNLARSQAPVHNALATFVVIGAFPHGFIATASSCPKVSTRIRFRLGHSSRARAFYRWAYWTPLVQSGVREIQATIDFTGSQLTVRRVHAYRELPKSSAKLFFPALSPRKEVELREAATSAAEAADAAAPKR